MNISTTVSKQDSTALLVRLGSAGKGIQNEHKQDWVWNMGELVMCTFHVHAICKVDESQPLEPHGCGPMGSKWRGTWEWSNGE